LDVTTTASSDQQDFSLTKEEAQPIFRIGSGEKEMIINGYGIWCAAVSIVTGIVWMVAMALVDTTINNNHHRGDKMDPHRAIFDSTGKIWAKTWLFLTGCYPTITGNVQQIQQTKNNNNNSACLYVANHASWLDIPVLCTVLDPVFKFIAKGELANVPGVGQQLHGGRHILIDREDRRSQLKTFKESMGYLREGVPLMAFPEGKRSPDGRLMEFKRGLFSLASKAQVPIIPITISNAAAIMPSYSYFPVQPGSGRLHVHIGDAISPEGKTEAELEALVRAEFLDKLPASQHPILLPGKNEVATVPVQALEPV
jgi:1-acyl-sn-glycerol-3-phosphate acyltransferase